VTKKDRADIENIAQRLRAFRGGLKQLEARTGASAIEEAGLSTAMALASIGLLRNMERSDS
jgi:hypothetical protein